MIQTILITLIFGINSCSDTCQISLLCSGNHRFDNSDMTKRCQLLMRYSIGKHCFDHSKQREKWPEVIYLVVPTPDAMHIVRRPHACHIVYLIKPWCMSAVGPNVNIPHTIYTCMSAYLFDVACYQLGRDKRSFQGPNIPATGEDPTQKLHYHDDVINWKHFPRYWPFVRAIHRSPVNSQHKGQWHGSLMFSLICVWINGWVNSREASDLRRYCADYDVTVMIKENDILRKICWVSNK